MADAYKTAFITGASSGLGRGLAAWFTRRGVRVFAAARRTDRLETLRHEVAAGGGTLEPVELDVADTEATVERIREIDRGCGGLDLIIANAGLGDQTHGRRLDWPVVERLLQVNVMGAAATISAVLPLMVERKRGHVVGISSVAAFRGMPRLAAYSGSKAFLSTFLQGLRMDLGGTGVAITVIHPGYVKSELTARFTHPMPFLLETAEACERMGRAILRRQEEYTFPLPVAAAMKALRFMPDALFRRYVGTVNKQR